MLDLEHSEIERPVLVQRVQDVGKEADRIKQSAAVDARQLGVHLGQALRSLRAEKGLGGRDKARKHAERAGGDGLGEFGHAAFADDGQKGDDVETPSFFDVLAPGEPVVETFLVGVGHGGRRNWSSEPQRLSVCGLSGIGGLLDIPRVVTNGLASFVRCR